MMTMCSYSSDFVAEAAKSVLLSGILSNDTVHPGRVEPTSPIELTTSRTEAPQAHYSLSPSPFSTVRSLDRGCPLYSWPPVRLRHMRGGVDRSRSLISSPTARNLCASRVECDGHCHWQRTTTTTTSFPGLLVKSGLQV